MYPCGVEVDPHRVTANLDPLALAYIPDDPCVTCGRAIGHGDGYSINPTGFEDVPEEFADKMDPTLGKEERWRCWRVAVRASPRYGTSQILPLASSV